MDADGSNQTIITTNGETTPHWGTARNLVAGVEFTQGIQELQSLGALEASLGGSATRAGGVGAQAFPGDNGKIAYVSLDAPPGIHTMNPDGSGDTFISAGGYPAFSPDGKKITDELNRACRTPTVHTLFLSPRSDDLYRRGGPNDQLASGDCQREPSAVGNEQRWLRSAPYLRFRRQRQPDLSADLVA